MAEDNKTMTIIGVLQRLRNDLMSWVRINLNVKQNKALSTDIQGKYVNKNVGGFTSGTTVSATSIDELIKTLLDIKSGVAPASDSFSFNLDPSYITASLDTTTQQVTANWTIKDDVTTYTGNYTPKINEQFTDDDNDGTPNKYTLDPETKTVSGSIIINIAFNSNDVSKTVSGSASYDESRDSDNNVIFESGSLHADQTFTIRRECYYGPFTAPSVCARTTKQLWEINSEITKDYFVIEYPQSWGKLSKVTNTENNYECIGTTFPETPESIEENGGNYYRYKSFEQLTGTIKLKIEY